MRGFTPATLVILIAYLVVFARFGLNDYTEFSLIDAGALMSAHVANGEAWRLFSAQIVHIGLLHLLFNAWFLWNIGPILERALGTERFVILYLLGGLFGNVASCLVYEPTQLSAGGSTSLFGLLGALLAILLRQGRSMRDFFENPAARWALGLAAVNLVIGFLIPFISQTGHVGGFLGGFATAYFLFKLPEDGGPPRSRPLHERISFMLFGAALLTLAIFPVHRSWFAAQELWNSSREMSDARVESLRASLHARGITEPTTRWLTIAGPMRGESIENISYPEAEGLVKNYRGPALQHLGLDYDKLDGIQNAIIQLNEGEQRVKFRMPLNPWLREPQR